MRTEFSWLKVANTITYKDELPLFTFDSGVDGPKVLITAGHHGHEPNSCNVAYQLVNKLKNVGMVKGVVKIVPIINFPGLSNLYRNNTLSYEDPNRCYPGNNKSISKKIAKHVWDLIKWCDYYVDIHTSSYQSSYVTNITDFGVVDKEVLESFRAPYILKRSGEDARGNIINSAFMQASKIGKKSVAIEFDNLVENVDKNLNYLLNFLKYLGVVRGEPTGEKTRYLKDKKVIKSDVAGFINYKVGLGETVETDQVICEITLLNGEVVKIKSPIKGVIMFKRVVPIINESDSITWIGEEER